MWLCDSHLSFPALYSSHSCFACFSFRGQTALHKAALYERRTICSLLVQAGASLTRTDYDVSNLVQITHAKLTVRVISILYFIVGDILTHQFCAMCKISSPKMELSMVEKH